MGSQVSLRRDLNLVFHGSRESTLWWGDPWVVVTVSTQRENTDPPFLNPKGNSPAISHAP